MTDEIEAYNRLSEDQISVKDACQLKPLSWTLPDYYKYFDLNEYLFGLVDLIEQDELYDQRVSRLSTEIFAFKEAKLEEVLRTLIYVVDEMKKQNVVWGVGRGSSCSSYLLFLLGLHEVDPVKYDVDLTDFIR
jgi:DNA polymerase III alpha subunit